MIIDCAKHWVYLANTKVASTATERALKSTPGCLHVGGSQGEKHQPLARFPDHCDKWSACDYLTCCVIRHPADKLISWFNYRSRTELQGHRRFLGNCTLDNWLETTLHEKLGINDPQFVVAGTRQVDLIFKYEQFSEFERFLSQLYGTSFRIPRVNVSPKLTTPSPAQRQQILTLLNKEIAWYEGVQAATAETAMIVWRQHATKRQ